MDISQALHALDDLEGNLAVAYDALSQRFALDPALVQLFGRLSAEESSHQNLVRYQLRLVMQHPNLFKDTQIDTARLNQAVRTTAQFRSQAGRIEADEAVRTALAMESDAAEIYFKIIVIESHPESAKFIQAMAGDCRAHVERIRTLAVERNWWKPPRGDAQK